eukprot:112-Prorocentrum_minimum.AAC.1
MMHLDIDMTESGDYSLKWSPPRMLLGEDEGDNIPKVIGNPPTATGPRGGRWVLPYWREKPRGRRGPFDRIRGPNPRAE